MKQENLNKLKKYVDECMSLNPDNVMNKTLELSNLYNRVLKLYNKEFKILKNLQEEKTILYSILYHKFKFNFEYELDNKGEIETYINSDNDYHQKKLEIQAQEQTTEYLSGTLDNIKNTSFFVQSYIALLKIQQGL